jgi:hypothetical protein
MTIVMEAPTYRPHRSEQVDEALGPMGHRASPDRVSRSESVLLTLLSLNFYQLLGRGRRGGGAEERRRAAEDACQEGRWDDCEKALDRAAQLDAQGDRTPQVAALREAIAAGRRRGAAREGGADGREAPP